jgi:hypothetical protein
MTSISVDPRTVSELAKAKSQLKKKLGLTKLTWADFFHIILKERGGK